MRKTGWELGLTPSSPSLCFVHDLEEGERGGEAKPFSSSLFTSPDLRPSFGAGRKKSCLGLPLQFLPHALCKRTTKSLQLIKSFDALSSRGNSWVFLPSSLLC